MYTVRIARTISLGTAARPSVTGIQYASLGDYAAAMRGELPVGMTIVSDRHCRTLLGAWRQAWRARRVGKSASIICGDRRVGQHQMWRAIAGPPSGDIG